MKWLTSYFSGSNTAGTKRASHGHKDMKTVHGHHPGNNESGEGFEKKAYRWRWRKQEKQTNWPGPNYLNKMRQEMDLNYILNQLCAIIRVNAPLPKGLDALLQEEQRSQEQMNMAGAWRSVLTVSVAALVLGVMFILNPLLVLGGFIAMMAYLAYRSRTLRGTYPSVLLVLMLVAMALTAYALTHLEDRRFFQDVPTVVDHVMIALLGVFVAIIGSYGFLVCLRLSLSDNPREAVLLRLRDGLGQGADLSQVMGGMPHFFPQSYTAIVQAGEASGQLGDCLETLVADSSAGLTKRNQILATLAPLGVTAVVYLVLFGFLLFKVTPAFKEIHESFETHVPTPFSDSIMAVINTFFYFLDEIVLFFAGDAGQRELPLSATSYRPALALLVPIALVLIAGLLVAGYRRHGPYIRRGLNRLFLRVPLLRGLIVNHNLEFISYMMARLLSAGATLDTTLARAAAGDLSAVYTHMLLRVQKRIGMGESLTEAFRAESTASTLPPAFTGMTAIGERAGMLPQAFDFLAGYYRSQKAFQEHVLMQLIQPVGIVLLGVVAMGFTVEMYMLLVGITEAILTEMY